MLLDVSANRAICTRTWPSASAVSVRVCSRVVASLSLRTSKVVVLIGVALCGCWPGRFARHRAAQRQTVRADRGAGYPVQSAVQAGAG